MKVQQARDVLSAQAVLHVLQQRFYSAAGGDDIDSDQASSVAETMSVALRLLAPAFEQALEDEDADEPQAASAAGGTR